jgi:hypothetical protein
MSGQPGPGSEFGFDKPLQFFTEICGLTVTVYGTAEIFLVEH